MFNDNDNNKSAWNSSSTPPKNIDEHDKQSSLEKDSVRIIDTSPEISSYVSPIGQNIWIPKTNCFSEKYQIIIGNLVDNTITRIIDYNMPYTTTVNSIVIIEEFNKLIPKMIIIGTKGEHMAWFIVEYPHLKNTKHPLSKWKISLIQERNPQLIHIQLS